jgi:hypothetical protein
MDTKFFGGVLVGTILGVVLGKTVKLPIKGETPEPVSAEKK